MMKGSIGSIEYEGYNRTVSWQGIRISGGKRFDSFVTNDVGSRLHDREGAEEFESHLRDLVSNGFAHQSLNEILAAENLEERDWTVGEAMAEAYLMLTYNVIWPWNMERDKRISTAS